MKKFYALSFCALMCMSAAGAAPNRFAAKQILKNTKSAVSVKKAAAAGIWRPASSVEYIYMDGEWMLMAEEKREYDNRGNLVKQTMDEDGSISIAHVKYNDDNQVTERLVMVGEEGEELVNSSLRTNVYDPIIKDYIIERRGYDWRNNAWVGNFYHENNNITRNADGNIIEIIKEIPLFDVMTPGYKSSWKYDAATGKANEFYYYTNSKGSTPEWELYDLVSYKNIEWDRTNGQMTKVVEELLEGDNRVKYADVYYNGKLDGHIIVTYTGEKDYVFKNTLLNPNEVAQEIRYEVLDNNGSYKITALTYLDEEYNLVSEPFAISTETFTYDEHGNLTSDEIEEVYGDELPFMWAIKYDFEYDAAGNATQMTALAYDEDEEEYIPESRTVYSDYFDVTAGVEDITVDGNEPVEYFNLQGVRVENPSNGLYIRRQGAKAQKVVM